MRILGMRRTLFVVPRELVSFVYAACTRMIAARERRRLEKMIVDSGISARPAAWSHAGVDTALRAVEARGEAFTSDITKDVPMLARRLRFGVGSKFEARRASVRASSRSWRWSAGSSAAVPAAPGSTASTGGCRWRVG